MQVTAQANELIIRIPSDLVELAVVQEFLDYLRFKSLVSKSQATEQDVEAIANEINESWLEKNRHRFTDENNH